MYITGIARKLIVQVAVAFIHAGFDSAVDHIVFAVDKLICFAQMVPLSVCCEWSQSQFCRAVGLNKRVADQNPVVDTKQHFLFQNYPTHLIKQSHRGFGVKIDQVFMSFGRP
ncbi:hypothetical protein SDC9_191572 [bioreactor metagenome]|uniref:Uncharacterized protein n=1 Tax=bioreactor metagenome TaxID=1076179 RepID=A0A645HY88_9ZZZZ